MGWVLTGQPRGFWRGAPRIVSCAVAPLTVLKCRSLPLSGLIAASNEINGRLPRIALASGAASQVQNFFASGIA